MSIDRKAPSAAFWATVVVVVALVAYPLTFGPACWLVSHLHAPQRPLRLLYWPLARVAWLTPGVAVPLMLVQYGAVFEDETRSVARNAIWYVD